MLESISVDVIVPAYNAERDLARAVMSVFSAELSGLDIRVLIVDDGSKDGTLRVAEELQERFAGKCRLLRHAGEINRGVSASRNLGLENSTAPWVAFLDSDDEYLPERFSGFISAIARNDTVDAVYDLAAVKSSAQVTEQNRWWGDAATFGIAEPLTGAPLLSRLLEGVCWHPSAVVVRRELLKRVGHFDPAKRIAEDCDLWFRMAAAGDLISSGSTTPVSIYWRHDLNTFQYRPEHRLAMMSAMLDSWRWARRNACAPARLQAFESQVPRYLLRSLVALREGLRPDLALALVWLVLRRGPGTLVFARNIPTQALAAARDWIRTAMAADRGLRRGGT